MQVVWPLEPYEGNFLNDASPNFKPGINTR